MSDESGPHWVGKNDKNLIQKKDEEIHIAPKALNIIWGKDGRYWQWVALPDSEFSFEGAELLQVNWIEVTGKLDLSQLETNEYQIVYVVKFKADAFGWHSAPIKFKVKISPDEQNQGHGTNVDFEIYRKKPDKWHHIDGGEFKVSKNEGTVQFGMFETDTDWWKGSMVLAGVIIKPKANEKTILIVEASSDLN